MTEKHRRLYERQFRVRCNVCKGPWQPDRPEYVGRGYIGDCEVCGKTLGGTIVRRCIFVRVDDLTEEVTP